MPDWQPIRCPYCRCWHEQPNAVTKRELCHEYCTLNQVKRAPPQRDSMSKRVHVVLDSFPELSEYKK